MRKNFLVSLYVKPFIFFALISIIMLVFMHTAYASSNTTYKERVITSIMVEEGDCLWGIANQYYTDEYKDVRNLVNEIKKTNGLMNDTIHQGSYLIIPYYQ